MLCVSLPQSCVSLIFGEDENFNDLIISLPLIYLKVYKNLKRLLVQYMTRVILLKFLTDGCKQIVSL